MTYVLLAFSLVELGVGIWLAIWIGRLKDQIRTTDTKLSQTTTAWNEERQSSLLSSTERNQLKIQLGALQSDYEGLLKAVEDGQLCTPASIAEVLRRGLSGSSPGSSSGTPR